MPIDENDKRYFMSSENIPRRYFYEVETWVKDREFPRRRKRITDEDLPTVDFMVVKIIPEEDRMNVTYNTIFGPFDEWDFLEAILAYDYGDEGSRQYQRAA